MNPSSKSILRRCGVPVGLSALLVLFLLPVESLLAQTDPLQIRIFNNSGTNADAVCLYNQTGSSITYT
ncbi:MAG: hypothetical protein ACKODZ_06855, partial [Verrucomicrobiota bacterium]